ncbi:MAG: pyruvate dehydrogenase (acetyl-transferring), homodimeric type [Acidobacteria bacterium]|nr:pyruvate dehydrogenase (acetyl-transferring), homodimeric type [Acidobacteriota bacterium]MBV9146193.1 pyruvate dehydrogenase (acetyl-transferring), homodimeric type [Acidobacteriota bacterium]
MNASPVLAPEPVGVDQSEVAEWLEAFDQIVQEEGPSHASGLLDALTRRAAELGVEAAALHTPYKNTIPVEQELPYPGDRNLERRVEALLRWNAMAMVHRQNKKDSGIGGHLATYSSLATLLEVGFNHFFHSSYDGEPGDMVYFQGHASPGVYARAFLEGRISEKQVLNFRHETRGEPALPSYPHPWLMPNFWRFPTVSMGIGPLNAIYQARFMRYLEHRSLIKAVPRKIWAFVGDGETDEVETLGALTVATREKLDNLIFVVNCNLQRLDGPVRGNGKIINELEGVFRGAGWHVIKVIWGSDWDDLLARDRSGLLLKRMEECVDGEYQSFKAKGGAYTREHFFGKYPETLELVTHLSDEQIASLHRGGHDPKKIYNAYVRAVEHKGGPTVILAKTVKGYGLGSAQARNATHQEKKLTDDALLTFRKVFDIPVPDQAAKDGVPYRPEKDTPEIAYMKERRKELGGFLPAREARKPGLKAPGREFFADALGGSRGRAVSTTMGFVSMLRTLLKHPEMGKLVVPIVPDEGRTFGLESAIRQVGIYASQGQLYTPHDQDILLYYREEKDGQILEEGITEAGSMASFSASGTSYYNYRLPTIPFYMYYSMFGFQRVGDLIWAFADARGKGFLMGGTAGRTTLSGEGLQHCDGHSLVMASVYPTCVIYDPAYAYEIAVIVQDGIRRMYEAGEDVFYYITMYNEDYPMPEMPKGVEEGILRGIYKYKAAAGGKALAQLFGSGPILNEVLKAQGILAEKYGVQTDVWSVTSYTELRREALATDRWNLLHPAEKEKRPYILKALDGAEGPIIAASDYLKIVPDQLSPWLRERLVSLGTDGFGRSDNREYLRKHFEISPESIVAATLSRLTREKKFEVKKAQKAFQDLGIDPEKTDPARA